MAVVASITLDHDGNPTTGPGDVLIGDREEHVSSLTARLRTVAAYADKAVEDVRKYAEAIVDSHRVVAVGEPVQAPAVEPEPVAPVEAPVAPAEAPEVAPVAQ